MYIPEQWQADGNKLIEDGREVAQFTSVTPIDNVPAFLEELNANHPDAEHSSEMETPGTAKRSALSSRLVHQMPEKEMRACI